MAEPLFKILLVCVVFGNVITMKLNDEKQTPDMSKVMQKLEYLEEEMQQLTSLKQLVKSLQQKADRQQEEIDTLRASNGKGGFEKLHSVSKRETHWSIAFDASLQHNIITHALGTVVNFDHVTVNDGGAYKSSTGVFIAPQSGLYFFTWSFLPEPGYVATMQFMKNGDVLRYSDSDRGMAGNSVVVRLNIEDQVWLQTYRSRDGIHMNHSAFCGFRISD